MYTITTATETQPIRTYQRLDAAKAFADKVATDQGVEIAVTDSESGTVAYLTSQRAIAKREQGAHFVPWTRLEVPTFQAPEIEGYYPAYTRKRIQATVYRAYDADSELPWLVLDGRTGGRELVANTTASRKLLTAMRLGRLLEA